MLSGCANIKVNDLTQTYNANAALHSGYKLGKTYVLQQPLAVADEGEPLLFFSKPGDFAPTVEEWQKGKRRKYWHIPVFAMLPAGTKVRVEKIISIAHQTGAGTTGVFRAEGVEKLIDPSSVSNMEERMGFGTLCMPKDKFLMEVK